MLPILMVLLLVGCIPIPANKSITYSFVYQAQVDPNQESARLLTNEEALLPIKSDAFLLPKDKKTHIVEVTNHGFIMFVYCEDKYLGMSLIVLAGEELFIDEPMVEVFNTTIQQEILKIDTEWEITWGLSSDPEAVSGRLIGLKSSPPATNYWAGEHIPFNDEPAEMEIVVKLPIFRTKENEIVKFDDVTFKVSAFRVYDYDVQWAPIVY